MEFWLVSAGFAAAVGLALLAVLLRDRGAAPAPQAAHDIAIYRDQLSEIDRDAARGVIAEGEAQRLRNEVKRRILEADRAAQREAPRPTWRGGTGRAVAGAAMAAVPVAGAFALYLYIGAPGYPDLPLAQRIAAAETARAERVSQAEAEARAAPMLEAGARRAREAAEPQFLTLIDRLRQTVAGRPDDLRGHMLLARNEAILGNYRAAIEAQERVIALRGDAVEARDLAGRAELMVLAAGGYVSPEAEAAFREVLQRDPLNGAARFYLGALDWQTGRPDRAFGIWRALLEQSPPDAPWVASIRERIGELAREAGVRYTPPPEGAAPLRGPAQADIEAAGRMSAADRMEMIRNMVDGLSQRLATQGGSAEEWAQLIRAFGVLEQTGQARAAWRQAQLAYQDDPGAMDVIRGAAQDAGVAQ